MIEVSGLVKRFGSVRALDGLDLTVMPGEVAGFLGPNGAGKSTTIRVLLGMYRRDGGTARVFGADPFTDAVAIHRRLAYVPGDVTLWPQLTGGECIDMLLSLRGRCNDATARQRAELLDRFELDPTRRSATYSKGNRQKVALVAALAAPAELLILDEPTSGLDPLMVSQFVGAVRERAAQGTAVLMSSHILGEVEELCETVTIVRGGKTVQSGALAELRHLRRSRVTATIPDAQRVLTGVGGIHDLTVTADEASFTVDDAAVAGLMAALGTTTVHALSIRPPSLEELFLQNYSDSDSVRRA